MQRKKSPNPLSQLVKGVLILHVGDTKTSQAGELMKTFNCEVLTSNTARMMIKGTLGNIQAVKECWLSKDGKNKLSQELNGCITQIIIGGRA